MPPAYEVLLLNTAIPQIQAAQSGDTYVVPRDIAINATAIISANSATDALRITQTGAGNALVVEDSANPDSTPFVVTAAGDVGVGTSLPAYKLDVNGAINIAAGNFFRSGNNPLIASNGSTINYIYAGTSALAWRNQADTTELMRLDSSGNLGLGVTPSAWGTTPKALQVGAVSSFVDSGLTFGTNVGYNYFTDNFSDKYIQTGFASAYNQRSGEHRWYNAPSGTAGNAITFTQAMTLDAAGKLLVGNTVAQSYGGQAPISELYQASIGNTDSDGGTQALYSTSAFGVDKGSATVFGFKYNTAGSYATSARVRGAKENATDGNFAGYLAFDTRANGGNITERARITSGGDFRVKGAGTGGSTDAFQISGSAPADAARLTSAGDFLIGTTTSQDPLTVNGGATLNGGLDFSSSGTKNWQVVGNAIDFYIGDQNLTRYAQLQGITTFTAWTFVSDRRLKHQIKDLHYGLDALMQIKPREFNFIKDDQFSIGFIAQELKEVIPEAVTGNEIEFADNDSPEERASKTMGISKEMLIPVLVKAIQEQQAMIKQLEAKVAALEAK